MTQAINRSSDGRFTYTAAECPDYILNFLSTGHKNINEISEHLEGKWGVRSIRKYMAWLQNAGLVEAFVLPSVGMNKKYYRVKRK